MSHLNVRPARTKAVDWVHASLSKCQVCLAAGLPQGLLDGLLGLFLAGGQPQLPGNGVDPLDVDLGGHLGKLHHVHVLVKVGLRQKGSHQTEISLHQIHSFVLTRASQNPLN